MNLRTIERTCERLAGDAAPVVYIIRRDELGPPTGDRVWGATSPDLCWILRPLIERAGRWRGPGAAMVVDIHSLVAGVRRATAPALRRRCARMELASLVVHELAHAAVDGVDPEPPPLPLAIARATVAEGIDRAGAEVPVGEPWQHHGLPWIRAALHLTRRAIAVGLPVNELAVVDTMRYGLSPTACYSEAMQGELRTHASTPLADVLKLAPPAGFARLWREDLEDHARRCVARTDGTPTRSAGGTTMKLMEIKHALTTRKAARTASFLGCAKEIARGKEVPVEVIERALEAAGKTAAELEAAVRLFERRIALAATIEAAADADAGLAGATAAIEKADAALRKAEEAHARAVEPHLTSIAELEAARRAAADARNELARTCPYDELNARAAAVADELGKLRTRAYELRQAMDTGKPATVDGWRERAMHEPQSSAAHHADRLEREARAAAAALPGVTARIAELEREESALRLRMTEA